MLPEGGGGYTLYIQPSGGGGERGGERNCRTKYMQGGGGGSYIYTIGTLHYPFSLVLHHFNNN